MVRISLSLTWAMAFTFCEGAMAASARFMGRDEPSKSSLLVLMRTGGPKSPKRVESIKKTWGRDLEDGSLMLLQKDESCTKLYGDNHWKGLTCLEAKNELQIMNRTDFEWLLVVDDDVYVFVQRLRETLSRMDPSKAAAYGQTGCGKCEDGTTTGFCGGGGYILSRQSLLKMASSTEAPVSAEAGEAFLQHMMAPPHNKWCDVRFGCVAQEKGLKAVNVKGLYGNGIEDRYGHKDSMLEETRVVQLRAQAPPLVIHNVRNHTHMQQIYDTAVKVNEELKGRTSPYSVGHVQGMVQWTFF